MHGLHKKCYSSVPARISNTLTCATPSSKLQYCTEVAPAAALPNYKYCTAQHQQHLLDLLGILVDLTGILEDLLVDLMGILGDLSVILVGFLVILVIAILVDVLGLWEIL